MKTHSISEDDKNLAVLVHLSGFLGYVVPFGNLIAPLVIWLTKKDTSPFVAEHAKNVLNFQISLVIYYVIAILLVIVLVGIPVLIGIFIAALIFMVKGAIAASDRLTYRYPATINFF